MEGKEVRFGIFNSALFATITTDASCGAVNSMHDSFTPLGGLVPLFNIQLGEVIFGGVGAGLYGMLSSSCSPCSSPGLMVGRTPEYLGKKIESYDVKMVDARPAGPRRSIILGFTAWAVRQPTGAWPASTTTARTASAKCSTPTAPATGNNGSAFAGLTANTPWYDTTLGIAMLIGRFLDDRPDPGPRRLAGARRSSSPPAPGTSRSTGVTFVVAADRHGRCSSAR